MNLEAVLADHLSGALHACFGIQAEASSLALAPTRKEFEGNLTFVTFPYAKEARRKPDDLAEQLGQYLLEKAPEVAAFNVVKGFLNLSIADSVWVNGLQKLQNPQPATPSGRKVMVEYSSPNTNKPLHLGHLRNNFLGHSLCRILEAAGHEVMKVNLVNDRGIHICKSMLAYQRFGKGETPESAGLKGDKLVGNYYVAFDKAYKQQQQALLAQWGEPDAKAALKALEAEEASDAQKAEAKRLKALLERAEKEAPLLLEAQQMLRDWEQGNPEVVQLWKTMNGWVLQGFQDTYTRIGVAFDKFYYESDTYLLGKDIIEEGLEKGVFFRKEDGSVWIDLTDAGLDQKLVLRADGTSVYITQDMGTADLKHADFPMQQSVYVVGNEQEYHFKVLKLILQRLGRPYADGLYHLSYGMVDLPSGKMKSREGTVVDADDLVQEMVDTAKARTEELGKIDGFSAEEAETLYLQLALGALKYYLLRVDPMKRMLFNPQESIDFQGNTGVFIQYTHARIRAVLRKAAQEGYAPGQYAAVQALEASERDLVQWMLGFEAAVAEAAESYAPSAIANYAYELARRYGKLYAELSILGEPDGAKKAFRLAASEQAARLLRESLRLLGIEAPERM